MPIWTLPDIVRPSPPTLTPAQEMFGRDIRFRQDFTVTSAGDWGVVDELDAVKQSVLNEAMTSPGEHALRPEYGFGLAAAVKEASTKSVRDSLVNRVRDRLARNPRITKVKEVSLSAESFGGGTALRLSLRLEAAGRDIRMDPLLIGPNGTVI